MIKGSCEPRCPAQCIACIIVFVYANLSKMIRSDVKIRLQIKKNYVNNNSQKLWANKFEFFFPVMRSQQQNYRQSHFSFVYVIRKFLWNIESLK